MLACDVKRISLNILDDIHAWLESSWISYYGDEIQRRLQKKLDDRLAQEKREARERKEKVSEDILKFRIECSLKDGFHKELVREYKTKFEREIWSAGANVKKSFEDRIGILDLTKVLAQLHQRHAWLEEHGFINEAFLTDFLKTELIAGVKQPFCFAKPATDPSKCWGGTIKWHDVDKNRLAETSL